jgi:ribosomal protein L30E
MSDELNDIKKFLKEEKVIIGTKDSLKNLKKGKVQKIWLSSNAPKGIKEDLIGYAKLSGVEVVNLNVPNDELGVLFKKQYSVSVASLVKGEH